MSTAAGQQVPHEFSSAMKTSGVCPACAGRLSMWDGVKAPTPSHLRCPHCRQRLRLHFRGFWLFAGVVAVLELALLAGCWMAFEYFDWLGLLVAVLISFVFWLVVELISGLIFYTWGEIVLYEGEGG